MARIKLASAIGALLRLRGAESNDRQGMPVRESVRMPGRHSIERLGRQAWWDTQTLICRLRYDRERHRRAGSILRHIGTAKVDSYWPMAA